MQQAAAIRQAHVSSKVVEGSKYIGTHHGTFHCDEALAVSLLKLLPAFAKHDILRTRNTDLLQQCEVVVDVGGEYDPERMRYDHHQKGFGTTFPNYKTKLSSAGLVYLHHGKSILKHISPRKLDESVLSMLHKKVYEGFVEHIDGIDNGVEISNGELNYKVPTTLSSRVSYLNPRWNEENSDEITNERFKKAMELTLSEFIDHVLHLTESWLPARDIVESTINQRTAVHDSGAILKFEQYCPWKSHLYDIEKERGMGPVIKFVLYEDSNGSMWRVQAVNSAEGKFELRLGLPQAWRGLRDDALSQVSGIPGCTFCHAGGFIGGNKTFDGALQMAIQALENTSKENDVNKRPRVD